MTDQEIIDAIAAEGEAEQTALDLVYDRHLEKVTAYLINKEIDQRRWDAPTLAYDLFIEAIMALRENVLAGRLTQFNSGGLATYLTTICRYKYYAHVRKSERILSPPPLVEESEGTEAINPQRLRRLIRELDDRCRELLTLFYFDRLPMREVIQLTTHAYNSVAAANVANGRCRKKLKTALLTEATTHHRP